MWDILLPTPEVCIKASNRGRTTKDLRTENEGRRCTNVAIFEVPLNVSRDVSAAYLSQFAKILGANCDSLMEFWCMLNRKPSSPYPTVLKMPKMPCWQCGETGHLSYSCPEKNVSRIQVPTECNPCSCRVCYFCLGCDGHVSEWDRSGETPGWVLFTDHIPRNAFSRSFWGCGEGWVGITGCWRGQKEKLDSRNSVPWSSRY